MKTLLNVFWQFFLLGLTSFGGPAAHIGYFQKIFVEKLKWIDAQRFAQLTALSQFLPGPGSSQLGFAIGLHRGGLGGAIAAFIGFTLPSFVIMFFVAANSVSNFDHWIVTAVFDGLKLLAVIVVTDAIVTMYKQFCQTIKLISVMLLTTVILLVFPSMLTQILAIAVAAIWGAFTVKNSESEERPILQTKLPWLFAFVVLFAASFFVSQDSPLWNTFAGFYQAGSLVFGGGHVVLPLLQGSVGSELTQQQFLTGYALAQGVPGPMFTLATYLGAQLNQEFALTGAIIATLAIFLPGFLLLLGCKDAWLQIINLPKISGASAAINASVVGLLLAALIQPISITAIHSISDGAIVVLGIALIQSKKLPIWMLIIGIVLLRLAAAFFVG
ncbi:MAG: chromate efflux transporter [Aliiglaciecola sp.]